MLDDHRIAVMISGRTRSGEAMPSGGQMEPFRKRR
jgi:hypothetical protein